MYKRVTVLSIILACTLPMSAFAKDSIEVNVDDTFGEYQSEVDENIYKSMSVVNETTLVEIYGDLNTPMFNKAKECINPCMAFATTWGEAGKSYPGVSMTTVMDFDPSTYKVDINWIRVASNLAQVDSAWYITNAEDNYNVNSSGNAYHIPNNLLQYTSGGRENAAMTGLGVGSYQITSSDWNEWDIDERVSPVLGWRNSLAKTGSVWTSIPIEPKSDLTVYAALSLSHQGGALPGYDFGKNLLSIINQENVRLAFEEAGREMYNDLLSKASTKSVSTADISIDKYLSDIERKCGINFSYYTGGPGRTNKGNYTATHCLKYEFYKNYFNRGMNK